MSEMGPDHHEVPAPQAVFDGARQFGLTDGEILQAIDRCLYEVGTDASVAELLDELTGGLARSILLKEQRALTKDQRGPSDQGPPAPEDRSSSGSTPPGSARPR
jgi:hypothetical protein